MRSKGPKGPYRELTLASLVGGTLVGAILNMGIVFAGLQIGFTIIGSTVGAIMGFGILRGVMRRGSILEVNIFQTVASSVNTVNAGVIFTVPVLFLMGLQDEISYPSLILATIAGSVLGVVLIIPLRKQIIDLERLRFPTAVGVAAILKSPGAGVQKARLLTIGIAVSMLVKFLTLDWQVFGAPDTPLLSGFWPEAYDVGELFGLPSGWHLLFSVGLLTLGAGYLAGRAGLAVLYGTILNFWILAPLCAYMVWIPAGQDALIELAKGIQLGGTEATDYADFGAFARGFRGVTSRNVGIGMILGGAIAGILIAAPALKSAIASLKSTSMTGRQEEVSMRVLNGALIFGMAALLLAVKVAGRDLFGWDTAILAALIGGVWMWVAGLVVAQTTGRTDWSPLSGLALIATALMIAIMGTEREFVIPAVTVGAAICVATSMCADMMADFKTGYLVGGMPLKQQIAQIATCWIGPAIALGTVSILWSAFAFGPDQAAILHEREAERGEVALAEYEARGGTPTKIADGIPTLSAAQADALQGAIEVMQDGDVPVMKYLTGAAIGLLVSLLVSPGLGVMVGLSMYLPFEYMIVFGVGGLLSILVSKLRGKHFAEHWGVPLAAGFIVGDAIMGVLNAVLKVLDSLV